MFCSKCGKEMAEGMAFCPSCGNPVNSVNQAAAGSPNVADSVPAKKEISAEEKTKKLVACGAFFFCMVLELFFLWWIVGSKGTIIIGNDHSERYINAFWDTFEWFFIILALFNTLVNLYVAFRFYIIAYINRSFDFSRLKAGFYLSGANIIIGIGFIFFAFYVNNKIGYFPVMLIVLGISIVILDFIATVAYRKAADYEYAAMLREKGTSIYAADTKPRNRKSYASKLASISGGKAREEYWECPECGARNRWLSDQCKDCGKYR